MRQRVKNLLLISVATALIAGCATKPQLATDVSVPSQRALVEFDSVVDVPFHTAYHNLALNARRCWDPDYSGETLSSIHTPPNPSLGHTSTAWIGFTVPGRLLGVRVPLVSIHLASHLEGKTSIVGTSFRSPNQWGLEHLGHWATSAASSCDLAAIPL